MANVQNLGIATGRLSKNVTAFANADGSRKMMVSVAVPNDYKGKDGKTSSEFVSLEGFVPAGKGDGVYALMHKGDLVSIQYKVVSNNYTDKDGKPVYAQVLRIEKVSLLESKAVTDARAARNEADAQADVDAEQTAVSVPEAE